MSREKWNGEARPSVCVVGLGYIGLPTAIFLAAGGYRVLGVDIDARRVAAVNSGSLPVDEPGLEEMFQTALGDGSLRASADVAKADAFFICVPTPSRPSAHYEGREAELGAVRAAARSVAGVLRPGNLVVLESTVPPGTTEGPVRAILEVSGLTVHRDGGGDAAGAAGAAGGGFFYLAHCPERVIPGRIAHELVYNDRVIGGCSREAAGRAAAVYRAFVRGDVALTDATTAEMVKLMENTFRDVNVALANEFAVLCEGLGIDAWEAIRLANRHPRVTIHRPGPGVGGHCIPVDPWFIVEKAPESALLIGQARRVNAAMPHRVVARARACLGEAAGRTPRVAVLGLTYKADVDDVRESPALEVVGGLLSLGIDVAVYDPHVSRERCEHLAFPGPAAPGLPASGASAAMGSGSAPPGGVPAFEPLAGAPGTLVCAGSALAAADGADLLLLLVPHREFQRLAPEEVRPYLRRPVLFDACGGLNDPAAWPAAGFQVLRLGAASGTPVAPGLAAAADAAHGPTPAAVRPGGDRPVPAPVMPGPDGGHP